MAGATRTAKKVIANVTEDEFNQHLGDFAAADAREAKIKAKLDEEMTKLREKVADELEELKGKKAVAFEQIQAYCAENKERLFIKRRSMETLFGNVGFRTGTPKLKTLKGYTWVVVLDRLKEKMPDYVRVTEEVNKEQLLADGKTDAQIAGNLKDVGVFIDQDESFFIDLKKESE